MSRNTQYNSAADTTFIQQVTASAVNAAIAIISEATNTVNHAYRIILATKVLNNPSGWGALFALGVSVNLALTTPVATDAAVDGAVSAIWDGYAGKL